MRTTHLLSGSAAAAIGLVALLLFLMTSGALGADLGMTKHTAPDADLYLTKSHTVQSTEIILVVNYASAPLAVAVHSSNGSVVQLTMVANCSSGILELTFPRAGQEYLVSLERGALTILTLTKSRPAVYIPPADDGSTWVIKPPVSVNPLNKYTQTDLTAALLAAAASITLQVLAITTAVVLAGALLGCAVKGNTKFLTPKDLISLFFYGFLIIDGLKIWQIAPDFNRLWYIPLVIGYWLGFLIWHIDIMLPIKIDSENKTMQVRPVAIYWRDDRTMPCIQEQTNRALLARWLGIYHEIRGNGSLNPDWLLTFKKPYFPKLSGLCSFIEKTETTQEKATWWRLSFLRKTTRIWLANASLMPYYSWLQNSKAFKTMEQRYEYSENDRVRTKLTHKMESMSMAADMITHADDISPGKVVSQFFAVDADLPPIDLEEHKFTDMQAAAPESSAAIGDEAAIEETDPAQVDAQDNTDPQTPAKRGRKPAAKKNNSKPRSKKESA